MSISGRRRPAVPALYCLQAHDLLFTTHRNHGHLLARGADPAACWQRSSAGSDGYNRGKGGTLPHRRRRARVSPHVGYRGRHHPLATGAAYAAKARKSGQIAVCLFGDGALEEGAAPEAFNMASIWKFPILYLCENNGKYGAGRAVGAAQSPSMAAYPLTDLPAAYKIPAQQMDGHRPRAPSTPSSPTQSPASGEGKGRNSSRRRRCAGREAKATGRWFQCQPASPWLGIRLRCPTSSAAGIASSDPVLGFRSRHRRRSARHGEAACGAGTRRGRGHRPGRQICIGESLSRP